MAEEGGGKTLTAGSQGSWRKAVPSGFSRAAVLRGSCGDLHKVKLVNILVQSGEGLMSLCS